jgi:hypothetical protein
MFGDERLHEMIEGGERWISFASRGICPARAQEDRE